MPLYGLGGTDGSLPSAGVIRDAEGNLYGTAPSGGTDGVGVVYELGGTGQFTVLNSFEGAGTGANPYSGVIRDAAGNLYGTTYYGGTASDGVVYKLDSTGKETLLYKFGGGADGANPYGGVIADSTGNLYGTTSHGGAGNAGVVYELNPEGQETVLYSFTGEAGGAYPYSGVIRDSAGNLYGTTNNGGTSNGGVVYKVDSSGNETVLHSFTGGADGAYPYSGVIRDSAGNLYGTTQSGGAANAGVVYKVDSEGNETVLYSFTGGADGGYPDAGVIRDSGGNLFGTTVNGGASNAGVVYKLAAAGGEVVLYSFTGGSDGGYPRAGVIGDSAGNLYGTAGGGIINNPSCSVSLGCGVVYKLDATGLETVLCSFTGPDGGVAYAGVIRDSAGDLFGTTYSGGTGDAGVVFELPGAAPAQ